MGVADPGVVVVVVVVIVDIVEDVVEDVEFVGVEIPLLSASHAWAAPSSNVDWKMVDLSKS
jgi:hypothetical protein